MFNCMGREVDIMWEGQIKDCFTQGFLGGEFIATHKPWKHLVSSQVYDHIRDNFLERRLAELFRI